MVMQGVSTHARVRMEQRGISASVLERLIEFGETRHDHRGCEILFFNKTAAATSHPGWGRPLSSPWTDR